jgi:hypothetical protein
MQVFKSREEAKWHLHKLLCHGHYAAEGIMNLCITEKDLMRLNKLLAVYDCKIVEA